MIDETMQKRIAEKARQVMLVAREYYKQDFIMPRVEVCPKQHSWAGMAYYADNRVTLSGRYFYVDAEDMVNNTLPHELAHLIAWQVYGRNGCGHGREWKEVMWVIGVKADRCHGMKQNKMEVEDY